MHHSLQKLWRFGITTLAAVALCAPIARSQSQTAVLSADNPMNLLSNGGFENMNPSYWQASGDGATWSREESRTPTWSLKLSGTGEASWSQPEAVRNWVPGIPGDGNPEVVVGAWVYTDGVNLNPASDDEKFQIAFQFFTDATQTTDVLGEPIVLDVPQDAASSGGWVEVSSEALGAITFPGTQAAKSATITLMKGANATGTVYFDDIFMRKADPEAPGWQGGWFNPNADVPDGWYYWWPDFDVGQPNWPDEQKFFEYVTDDDAFEGDHSLRIESNGVNQDEVVGVSERVPVDGPIVVSFRVKHEGNIAEDSIGVGDNNLGITALWYNNLEGGAAGWGEIGGVDVRLNGAWNAQFIPKLGTSSTGKTQDADWTQYAFVFYPPDDAVGVEIRPRYWHAFTGVTYWDDFFVAPLADLTSDMADMNLLSDGGFETMNPSYWEASGDGATWTRDESRTPAWSLALSGSGEASWSQPEAVLNWVPGIPGDGNPEVVVGAWVYTDGVNVSPASDDEKFQVKFQFFTDATQTTDVLGEPIILDVPQDAASSGGWVEISSEALGAITFPGTQAAKSATITLMKGANATGTVYFDDVFLRKADPEAPGWQGGWFNPNADVPDGWYYWWPDFDVGQPNWPDEQKFFEYVTDDDAVDGDYSLRIESNGLNQDEVVGVSERVPVTVGEPVLVSFFVEHEGNVAEDSIGMGDNNLGITMLSYDNLEAGAAGWGEIGGLDIRLNGAVNEEDISEFMIPKLGTSAAGKTADAGWAQYGFVYYPVDGAVGIEIRPRYWHAFSGVTHWDNFAVIPLGGLTVGTAIEEDPVDGSLPAAFRLNQNYPNPFNPATTISFDLKQSETVSLGVYNVLGQKVATLLDRQLMTAGTQSVEFNAGSLPSGLYLYVLEVNDQAVSKKMVLLK